MGASSYINNFALLGNYIVSLCLLMLQKLDSSILMGILNLECDVWPPNTTPDVAIEMPITPLDLVVASNAWYNYVFPVPPEVSTKKTPLVP